ncbi:hypothetical protein AAFF_G00165700 [Aldrovandia affinis]|uniref:Transmembrane protein 52 n=1 Tax=Aldrovandia affinis TaxID=143900 RepID=A0AAD7RME6_9TELE|nr:hypothetical protein AAFF_G00165700 [Aldrovandia affinis]
MRSMDVLIPFLVLLVSFTVADPCTKDCRGADPSRLWLIVIFIFVMFVFGCIAGCLKVCCRKNKAPVPTFEGHPFEVTVISTVMDNQSAIHSISTISSPQSGHPPQPFTAMASRSYSPPPYNLYAQESPPQYDEALAMPADAGDPRAGIGGNVEDGGERRQTRVSGEGLTEFTQEPLQWEALRDSQDNAAMGEEAPPAYEPHTNVAEEELSEIDLN